MCVFKSGVYYCLYDVDLEDILNTEEPTLQLYLQGSFCASCLLQRYELDAAVWLRIELVVYKPTNNQYSLIEHRIWQKSKHALDLEWLNPFLTSMYLHMIGCCAHLGILFNCSSLLLKAVNQVSRYSWSIILPLDKLEAKKDHCNRS